MNIFRIAAVLFLMPFGLACFLILVAGLGMVWFSKGVLGWMEECLPEEA